MPQYLLVQMPSENRNKHQNIHQAEPIPSLPDGINAKPQKI
ncbi:hypothetical protein NEIFLAOT_01341 [Neisseria flavescens NRL30031/H210]|uniref:Uncharacterized protein n=1 Tax=Neisseria flavescens NRL30031/H210 TaxID=546264 RepID=C0EN11_NEIFL|nr:hypothetical protein NEIFLAOT_01341 [Neisseria flavescens NRL30031/H210]